MDATHYRQPVVPSTAPLHPTVGPTDGVEWWRGLGCGSLNCGGPRARRRRDRTRFHLAVALIELLLDQLVAFLGRSCSVAASLGLALSCGTDAAEAHDHLGTGHFDFPKLAGITLLHLETPHACSVASTRCDSITLIWKRTAGRAHRNLY